MIIDDRSLENFKASLQLLVQNEAVAKEFRDRSTVSDVEIKELLATVGLETQPQLSPIPWRAGFGAERRWIFDAAGETICELTDYNMACNRSRIIATVNGASDD